MYSSNVPICSFGFFVNKVFFAFRKLKNSFTAGHDNLPSFLLKDCARIFASPVSIIFNLAMKMSTFPELWKIARICSVFRKEDAADDTVVSHILY